MATPRVYDGDGRVYELLDPRQKMFWDVYLNPKHKYFCNAYRSALQVGYSDSYAKVIAQTKFFKERLRRYNLLSKAEFVIDKALNYKSDIVNSEGEEEVDKELLRIQTDVAKHITKTLGKDEGYSERSEHTGKDGNPIVFMPQELMDKFNLSEKE